MSQPNPKRPLPSGPVDALSESCQQLARQARFLSLAGQLPDPLVLEEIHALVRRAGAQFQRLDPRAKSFQLGDTQYGRALALRMLQSGAPEPDPALMKRSEDKPPSGRHLLSLRGAEGIFSAPDLIAFLSEHHKTGILEIRTTSEHFVLELDSGMIAHLQCDRTPAGERLGDLLVEMKAISRENLESARSRNQRGRLGEILVKSGLVREELLFEALRKQIPLLFQLLFGGKMHSFTFWAGPLILAEERLRLNATALLLDCARIEDEGAQRRDAK